MATSHVERRPSAPRNSITSCNEAMSPVKVPANLPDLVRASFHRAKANGDVNFYPTQVAVLSPASTPASTSPSLQVSALRPASSSCLTGLAVAAPIPLASAFSGLAVERSFS